MRRRTKLALVIAGIITALGLVYALAIFAFVDSFRMIPQDCLLLERSLLIHVSDVLTGQPVSSAHLTIRNVGGRGFEGSAVNLTGMTEHNGDYREDQLTLFGCDTLIIEVSAEGYEKVSFDRDIGVTNSTSLKDIIALVPRKS